ncbi:MAG: RusA family crossover junction endodeoxyribonuclease [Caulobacteraceae bacterium]|nr:RusA family crossover junction endodeoxyribonuclease [Caulobacteraceae bacterium]
MRHDTTTTPAPVALWLTLPIPPSTNAIWRCQGRRIRKSKNYRIWLEQCDLAALEQRVPRHGWTGPHAISIVIRTGPGWRGNRDLDNCLKPILDWLVHWHVIEDDCCSIVRSVSISIDTQPISSACAEVTIDWV